MNLIFYSFPAVTPWFNRVKQEDAKTREAVDAKIAKKDYDGALKQAAKMQLDSSADKAVFAIVEKNPTFPFYEKAAQAMREPSNADRLYMNLVNGRIALNDLPNAVKTAAKVKDVVAADRALFNVLKNGPDAALTETIAGQMQVASDSDSVWETLFVSRLGRGDLEGALAAALKTKFQGNRDRLLGALNEKCHTVELLEKIADGMVSSFPRNRVYERIIHIYLGDKEIEKAMAVACKMQDDGDFGLLIVLQKTQDFALMEKEAEKMKLASNGDCVYKFIAERKMAAGDSKGAFEVARKMSSQINCDRILMDIVEKCEDLDFAETVADALQFDANADQAYQSIADRATLQGRNSMAERLKGSACKKC